MSHIQINHAAATMFRQSSERPERTSSVSSASGRRLSGDNRRQSLSSPKGTAGETITKSTNFRETCDSVADEFVCPITMELPVEPIMAEDGFTYDKAAMEKLIQQQGKNLRSPYTNEPMGPKLLPAVQVRNVIEKLVSSGAINGEKAEHWKERVRDERELKDVTQRAGDGEEDAMYKLGCWYGHGKKGLRKDSGLAYEWYRKSADHGCVKGMAAAGYHLVKGLGVEMNKVEGMSLLGMATYARGGSDFAAYFLGIWYDDGSCGLPQNKERAMFWLKKVVDQSCEVRHLTEYHRVNAADRLKKLREEPFKG